MKYIKKKLYCGCSHHDLKVDPITRKEEDRDLFKGRPGHACYIHKAATHNPCPYITVWYLSPSERSD